jgi:hypothetical protein
MKLLLLVLFLCSCSFLNDRVNELVNSTNARSIEDQKRNFSNLIGKGIIDLDKNERLLTYSMEKRALEDGSELRNYRDTTKSIQSTCTHTFTIKDKIISSYQRTGNCSFNSNGF